MNRLTFDKVLSLRTGCIISIDPKLICFAISSINDFTYFGQISLKLVRLCRGLQERTNTFLHDVTRLKIAAASAVMLALAEFNTPP